MKKVLPTDPNVTRAEKPRLSGQCRLMLERLRRGPASNRELASISLKYASRISDLRAAGYRIVLTGRDHLTGQTRYRLEAADGQG